MNVSNNVKKQYHSTSIHKNLLLYFPELDLEIRNSQIYEESMYLRESIFEKKSLEFVGCISSVFMIDVNGLQDDIKGKEIIVSITTDETLDEPIWLFNGIVDSAVRQDNKRIKKITAYDCLYKKGNTEVAAWYKSLIFPITLKNLRDSLFNYIGLEQVETSLPNDGVTIRKQYDPNTLQALAVIKAICQINGAFGIVNREGKFEYRILGKIRGKGAYPGPLFIPGPDMLPGVPSIITNDIKPEFFSYYRRVDYEEYEVKVIDKVTIRQSEDDSGVTYGSGTNNYIVQGNIFTYGLAAKELTAIAKNIYTSIGGFSYYPFQSENNGLPFLECGLDAVSYYVVDWEKTTGGSDIVYEQRPFYILNRELSGIQSLKDSYSAKGEEYQSEFITDLQTQIDLIKKKQGVSKQDIEDYVGDYTYSQTEIDDMFANFDPGTTGGGFNVESVAALPSNPDSNTIYLIQGKVVVN